MIKLNSPIACVWEITNRCNFHCPHCRAYEENPIECEVTENLIIEQLIKNKLLSVNISGGEPLLNPRINQIISKLNSKNIDVGISTNGYLYEKYAISLKKSGVSFVQISLDGPKNIHDTFRGVIGAFDKAVSSIKLAKNLGHFVQMNTTITRKNIDYIFENIKIAEQLGIDRIFFRRVVSAGLAEKNTQVIPEKNTYINLLNKLIDYKYSSDCKINISIDDPIVAILDNNKYNENSICCSAGITSIGIDSNGNVFPCIFARQYLGNICDMELSDIWKKSECLKQLRERNIEICGECKYKKSCGGCRGAVGIYKWDNMCPIYDG